MRSAPRASAIFPRVVMGHGRLNRDHDVDAFATCQFGPAFKIGFLKHASQLERGVGDEGPLDAVTGIKIEHEHVGMFEVIDGRVPRMKFDRTHIDKSQ
jgi:hypothetical protein